MRLFSAGFWKDARARYLRTKEFTSLHNYYPSVATWLDKNNVWPSISVSWSKSESHNYHYQSSADGGGSFSAGGFFSIGGSSGVSRVHDVAQDEATKIDIKFDYLRVDFRRPWLNCTPFSDRRWRFACGTDPEVKKWVVSSGPQPDVGGKPQYPSGIMPVIPTGFLIARNATVTGNFSKDFRDYYKQTISASHSGGFGPFRIRGSYNETVEKTDVNADTASNGFTIGNPQVIGFFVEVLPASPDPLPGLFQPCDNSKPKAP